MPTLDNLQSILSKAISTAPLGTGFGPAMEAALVKGHTAAVLAAAAERAGVRVDSGLFKGLSKAERADIKQAVQEQLKYLKGFLAAKGDMSEAAIRARAQLYAGSIRATYGRARYPGLRQYPGDGGTQCLTNCKCSLDERDDGIYWVLNPAEHCNGCLTMAAGSPYSV
jgi:hypothetical protein